MESFAERVKGMLRDGHQRVITCAASLAHHELLGSVKEMVLDDIDLTSVPAEHLVSLASSVTDSVNIRNVSGCGLVTILDSVKIQVLRFINQSLGSEETRALVRAMEAGVKVVRMGAEVTLDIGVLMEYSGQGKCWNVVCYGDTAARYRDNLRRWATSRNWAVKGEDEEYIFISRN